jgi:hypothetical protein
MLASQENRSEARLGPQERVEKQKTGQLRLTPQIPLRSAQHSVRSASVPFELDHVQDFFTVNPGAAAESFWTLARLHCSEP